MQTNNAAAETTMEPRYDQNQYSRTPIPRKKITFKQKPPVYEEINKTAMAN